MVFGTLDDITRIVISTEKGIPVYLGAVADVILGNELRTGAATEDGKEVVLGNRHVDGREQPRGRAACGVEDGRSQSLVASRRGRQTVYDRTNLVDATIDTVRDNLMVGALLVIVVLFVFLGNFRAALITACVIPPSMLMTITARSNVVSPAICSASARSTSASSSTARSSSSRTACAEAG